MPDRNYFNITLVLAAALLSTSPALAQKFPLHEVSIQGAERLSAGAVIIESGLRMGASVNQSDFEAAAERLQQTGMFRSVRFAFQPKTVEDAPGYSLTFRVEEVDQLRAVVVDIPALTGVDVFAQLPEIAPFAHPQIPDTPEANAYYRTALEKLTAKETGAGEEISSDIYNDLQTGELIYIFRPKVLPRLKSFHVEGTQALSPDRIHETIDDLVIGEEYTERRFRQYLTENILPLYGELGRLKAKFVEVKATAPTTPGGALQATVRVEEGGEYQLTDVEIAGDQIDASAMRSIADFPVGKRADQTKIDRGLQAIRTELSRDGYLNPRLAVRRSFTDADLQVALRLDVDRGSQFTFGALTLMGLDAKAEAAAHKRWRLQEGDPMDATYVDEFLKDVLQRVKATGVAQDMKVREFTRIIDLTLSFR